MIAGTIRPDAGRVLRYANVSFPLGFAGSFNAALTGEQNVRFVARIYQRDTNQLIDFVREFAELGKAFHMPVHSYSSGMKSRLAFGISMGIDFDYYLVDETMAVGDKRFKVKCRETFQQKLAHSDIIMVSHSVGNLKEYCSAGIVLEGGELTYYSNIDDALAVHDENMKFEYRP